MLGGKKVDKSDLRPFEAPSQSPRRCRYVKNTTRIQLEFKDESIYLTMTRKAMFKPQIRTKRLQQSLTTLNFPRGHGVIGQSRHSGANLGGFSLETLDLVPGQDFESKN